MRYRTLTVGQSHEIAAALAAASQYGIDSVAGERGDGVELDESELLVTISVFKTRLESGDNTDVEVFEGQLAAQLHPWFESIPIEVLDDPGFWRYLAVKHFWWYTAKREATPISKGNINNLVDATKPAEQIPLRLYLRTKAIDSDGDVALAGEISESTDFWRSHITRVRVGSAPVVARKFAEKKRDDDQRQLTTNPLRRVARRLNRTWANTNLDLYDEEDANRILDEIIEREV